MLKSTIETNALYMFDGLTEQQCLACVNYLANKYGMSKRRFDYDDDIDNVQAIENSLYWYYSYDKRASSYCLKISVNGDAIDIWQDWHNGPGFDLVQSYFRLKEEICVINRIANELTAICEEL